MKFSLAFTVWCTLLGLTTISTLRAQADYQWWNEINQWDGTTPWVRYLTLNTAHMGPNALPVPDFEEGRMPGGIRLQMAGESHLMPGETTLNTRMRLFLPLYSKRAGLSLHMVPLERYEMDTVVRDARSARDRDGQGYSVGDLYLGTYIQLTDNHPNWPDLLLRLHLRTASGNRLEAARFTDTPGYYFDLTASEEWHYQHPFWQGLRAHFALGFYAWQTHRADYLQNDALLASGGLSVKMGGWHLSQSLAGYHGYLRNGDRPLVWRIGLSSAYQSRIRYFFRWQKGLHDFPYWSLRAGVDFRLKPGPE